MNPVKFSGPKCDPGHSGVIYSPELAKSGGYIILVSGPSGVGKGSMITQLLNDPEIKPLLKNANSVTTRKPRPGEKATTLQKSIKIIKKIWYNRFFSYSDKQSVSIKGLPAEEKHTQYSFVSHKKFLKLKEKGKLFQFTCYDGNWYGTDLPSILQQFKNGFHILMELTAKEALKIKSYYPDKALAIFISPPFPEIDTLRKRLEKRGTNSKDSIERRLQQASQEFELKSGFDEIVINDNNQMHKAVNNLKEIILLKLKGLINQKKTSQDMAA